MKLEYIECGDYMIPKLKANEEPVEPLTKYGLMRRKYLKEHRSGIYAGLMLEGKLKEHCLMIQEQANDRFDLLVAQMAQAEGVTEDSKAVDQMKWVRLMNNIRARAEEMVLSEIVYQ